ncbi:MAG: AAA family ATPase [Actinobacteria bacterium]|nr:AAA family ATPase [Actinomycetota bacterium]
MGRIGLGDDERHRILIDWRAPVGSTFYRATAAAPHGVIRRRTLVTQAHRVIDINDDLLISEEAEGLSMVAGEGALLHALAAERGQFMQDIVATIQAEQDEIIRADPKASVVLTGGPGTGKSVVALHRTAYLMYERSAELERRGVLVVGPGTRFSRYISRVLPSLGETAVTIRSVYDLVDGAVATGREPLAVARIKGRPAMAKVLKAFLIASYPPAPKRLTLTHAGHLMRFDARELEELRSSVLGSAANDFNKAGMQIVRALSRKVLLRSGQSRPPAGEAKALAREFADETAVVDAVEVLLPHRKPADALNEMGKKPDLLLKCLRKHFPEPDCRLVADHMAADPSIHVGDVPLIDELDWLLGSRPPRRVKDEDFAEYEQFAESRDRLETAITESPENSDFGHIVVDEAQDLSPMQWRMLARRGPDATWTVVADPRQATLSSPDELEAAIARTLPARRTQRFTLAINYRTPRQIMQYAAEASGLNLGGLRSIREGEEPVFFALGDDPGRAIREAAQWLDDQPGSGCFIVVDEAHLEAVRTPSGKVEVLTALEAKGLEFDNVVLFRPERLDTSVPWEASLVLIGATRATKRLGVITGPAPERTDGRLF